MKNIFKSILLIAAFNIAASCVKNLDAENTAMRDRLVVGASVPSTAIYTAMHHEYTIQGKGYKEGDKIFFVSGTTEIEIPVKAYDDYSITLDLTGEIPTGVYIVVLSRGSERQTLGKIDIRDTISLIVPDKEGMNLKGIVFCGKNPIEGAVVSDGEIITITDENGYYWMQSNKPHGYVFVSIPDGYTVRTKDGCPIFFQRISTETNRIEQANFELIESPVKAGGKFTLFHLSDIHLANRLLDMSQFTNTIISDMTAQSAVAGQNIITINTGDMTFDTYWRQNQYNLEDYVQTLKSCNFSFPTFHIPGNHDNDCYTDSDFKAEQAFKNTLGPTYYSFNMGGIHFIMLDSIIYINNGGSSTSKGDCSYTSGLSSLEFTWLQRDLATIKDKSKPLFICSHSPLFRYNSSLEVVNSLSNADAVIKLLEDFPQVHVLSGHIHNNSTMVKGNIIDHNVAAGCATWWWTGYYGNPHICKDGTPGGYCIYEINDYNVKWKYHGCNYDEKKVFRTYDMNQVKTYLASDPGYAQLCKSYPERENDYSDIGSNAVLINVWGWDETWTVEVTESGNPLNVQRVYMRDPLHTICYDGPRVLHTSDRTLTEDFQSENNFHMFLVKASNATSSITVKVTDRFGNVYTETMTRPKEFSINNF